MIEMIKMEKWKEQMLKSFKDLKMEENVETLTELIAI
jgi:hypothetical protein